MKRKMILSYSIITYGTAPYRTVPFALPSDTTVGCRRGDGTKSVSKSTCIINAVSYSEDDTLLHVHFISLHCPVCHLGLHIISMSLFI